MPGNLACDGDEGDGVHLGVGETGHQVERTGSGRGHHDAGFAAGPRVTLGGEDASLFVAGQDGADAVAVTRESLMNRHARPAGIGEDDVDIVAYERFDEDVRSREWPGCGFGQGPAIVDGGHGGSSLPVQTTNRILALALGRSITAHDKILQCQSTPEQSTETEGMLSRGNALVTGASSGIGRELVRQLVLGRGMTVLATARRRDRLETLARELTPGRVQICSGDLADAAFRQTLWEQAELMPGGIDLVINNAGLGSYSDLESQDPEAIRQVIEINVIALIDLTQKAIRHMKNRGGGQILQISSVLGFIGLRDSAVYVASKHAVNGLVKSSAL